MPADPSRIVTARQMLAHLGLTLADLAAQPDPARRMPTLADYLPRVAAAASPGTRRTYGTYWDRMVAVLGHLRLDEVTASDIEALMRQVTATAYSRRTGRQGRHAGELSSRPPAPSTAVPSPTATSPPRTAQPTGWPSRAGCPTRAGPSRPANCRTSTWLRVPAATTSSSTPSCCACQRTLEAGSGTHSVIDLGGSS
ncbi:hypothetical protein V6U90_30025 [Micromonospora sp. CPCC 206060]